MTDFEQNRAALFREREARLGRYTAAVAARDALPADADAGARRRADARVGSAIAALNFWRDPIPAAKTASEITAPAAFVGRAGAVSPPMCEADKLAASIIASASAADGRLLGRAVAPDATAADQLAAEIVAAAELAEREPDADSLADQIIESARLAEAE
jgi:hypothetical protein